MSDPTHWSSRAPEMLLDEGVGRRGNPCPTPLDRRWLWRLESFLAVNGTNPLHHQMGADLRQYLNETCEHHWQRYDQDQVHATHQQCLWCNDIEWWDEDLGHFVPGFEVAS